MFCNYFNLLKFTFQVFRKPFKLMLDTSYYSQHIIRSTELVKT